MRDSEWVKDFLTSDSLPLLNCVIVNVERMFTLCSVHSSVCSVFSVHLFQALPTPLFKHICPPWFTPRGIPFHSLFDFSISTSLFCVPCLVIRWLYIIVLPSWVFYSFNNSSATKQSKLEGFLKRSLIWIFNKITRD